MKILKVLFSKKQKIEALELEVADIKNRLAYLEEKLADTRSKGFQLQSSIDFIKVAYKRKEAKNV